MSDPLFNKDDPEQAKWYALGYRQRWTGSPIAPSVQQLPDALKFAFNLGYLTAGDGRASAVPIPDLPPKAAPAQPSPAPTTPTPVPAPPVPTPAPPTAPPANSTAGRLSKPGDNRVMPSSAETADWYQKGFTGVVATPPSTALKAWYDAGKADRAKNDPARIVVTAPANPPAAMDWTAPAIGGAVLLLLGVGFAMSRRRRGR